MGRHADPTAPEHRLPYLLKVSLIYQIPHYFHNLLHGRKLRLVNLHVWVNMFDLLMYTASVATDRVPSSSLHCRGVHTCS